MNIVRIAKIVALLAFVLPWVAVSCSVPGQGTIDLATASGIELIQGKMTANPDAEKQMGRGMGNMLSGTCQARLKPMAVLAGHATAACRRPCLTWA